MSALFNKSNEAGAGSDNKEESSVRRKAWKWAKQNIFEARRQDEKNPQEESTAVQTTWQDGRHVDRGHSLKFEVSRFPEVESFALIYTLC